MEARDLNEWLVLETVPIGSVISLDEILAMYFYANIPKLDVRIHLVHVVIKNLIDRGFLSQEKDNTFTKRYFMDRT